MSDIEDLKDPILKSKAKNYIDNPSGDTLKELTDQDMNVLAAAGGGLSNWLGNKGKYCTITKECMLICGK